MVHIAGFEPVPSVAAVQVHAAGLHITIIYCCSSKMPNSTLAAAGRGGDGASIAAAVAVAAAAKGWQGPQFYGLVCTGTHQHILVSSKH
jgi:hypothetical protein